MHHAFNQGAGRSIRHISGLGGFSASILIRASTCQALFTTPGALGVPLSALYGSRECSGPPCARSGPS